MAHTVTGKLNKPAQVFQAGESTGFGVRIGVQYYDRKTKKKEWTNYKAAIFVRNPAQIEFYKEVLVEGAIVEISGSQQKIETYDGNSGTVFSIELLDAKLGYIGSISQPQQSAQQQTPQQQAPQRVQQQAPTQAPQNGGSDWDEDDIPF